MLVFCSSFPWGFALCDVPGTELLIRICSSSPVMSMRRLPPQQHKAHKEVRNKKVFFIKSVALNIIKIVTEPFKI